MPEEAASIAPAPVAVQLPSASVSSVPPQSAPIEAKGGPPEAVAPVTPEPLDPNYVVRGGRWKLSEEDLRSVPRHVLERMMVAADSEVMENLHRARHSGQPAAQPPPQQYPPIQSPAAQPPPQQTSGPFSPVELKFDDADEDAPSVLHAKALNEGMTKNFNALHGHVASQINQIVLALNALREFQDSVILDRHLSSLGNDWKDTFGEGSTMDIDRRSPFFQNRSDYKKAIVENLELDAQLGRERDLNEATLRARYRLYGKKIAEIERSQREVKAKDAAKGLPAPTGAPNGRAPAGGLRDSVNRAVFEMTAAR